jgi:peptide chain release factor 2
VSGFTSLSQDVSDIIDLLGMAKDDNDTSVLEDLAAQVDDLTNKVTKMETARLLSGPQDGSNAFVSFAPGAGGVDSADWAEMLLRMISRYCEQMGFDTTIVDILENPEGGIKSATLEVTGEMAYGYLRSEAGIHRLVRISPYDAAARRHTSFAAIDVIPEVSDDIDIDIKDEDLRIDTYRAGGHGGQHVNKTDSAVRITHLPTKTVVQCQNERSQHKNKAQAMKVLKSRLYDRELDIRRKEADERNAEKKGISWGSQIRSYVLAPYRLVKDTRTAEETGNVDAVLDGEIHRFVRAFLLATAED